jgi:hypothetical protein
VRPESCRWFLNILPHSGCDDTRDKAGESFVQIDSDMSVRNFVSGTRRFGADVCLDPEKLIRQLLLTAAALSAGLQAHLTK